MRERCTGRALRLVLYVVRVPVHGMCMCMRAWRGTRRAECGGEGECTPSVLTLHQERPPNPQPSTSRSSTRFANATMASLSNWTTVDTALAPLVTRAEMAVMLRETGGRDSSPEAWSDDASDSEAMKKRWAGALICFENSSGAGFGYVPTKGAIVRFHEGEFELRIVTDGSESGSWVKRQDAAIQAFWPGAMMPISASERREPQLQLGECISSLSPCRSPRARRA